MHFYFLHFEFDTSTNKAITDYLSVINENVLNVEINDRDMLI